MAAGETAAGARSPISLVVLTLRGTKLNNERSVSNSVECPGQSFEDFSQKE